MNKVCPDCNNTRYIYEKDSNGFIISAKPCEACKNDLAEMNLERKLIKSEIPLQYHSYTFESYQGKDEFNNIKILKDFAENIDNIKYRFINLFLTGNKSCQKTTMLCVMGKELLKKNKEVKFVLAGDLIKLLMKDSGYGYDAEILKKINHYKMVDILLIDDIFDIMKSVYWSNSNNLVITEWDLFLRYRLSHGLRIITTSNFNLNQIKEKFGESIQSLFNRNFKELKFCDNIEKIAMSNIEKIFD